MLELILKYLVVLETFFSVLLILEKHALLSRITVTLNIVSYLVFGNFRISDSFATSHFSISLTLIIECIFFLSRNRRE